MDFDISDDCHNCEYFNRIKSEIELCRLESRLQSFLPTKVFLVFKKLYYQYFEDCEDFIKEVISYLVILSENFKEIDKLFINIPVAILDYKKLVLDLCPGLSFT